MFPLAWALWELQKYLGLYTIDELKAVVEKQKKSKHKDQRLAYLAKIVIEADDAGISEAGETYIKEYREHIINV